MVTRFSLLYRAVVTGKTRCSKAAVVHVGRNKTIGGVTAVAGGGRRNMLAGFAYGCRAVVAGNACCSDAAVVHDSRNPVIGGVAVVAVG